MNVEELKQVGDILSTLSGHAYNGFLIWIGKEYLDIVLKWVFWFVFWVMGFKVIGQIVNVISGAESARQEKEKMLEEIDIKLMRNGIHVSRTPSEVIRDVCLLIKNLGGKQ